MLTAYTYAEAKMLDGLVDMILVGDSLGNVVLGEQSTQSVQRADMFRHTKAVRGGVKESKVVVDIPFGEDESEERLFSCAESLTKAGADILKLEGNPVMLAFLVKQGFTVMGHVGLLPQTAKNFSTKGNTKEEQDAIMDMAISLERAGACAVLIEKTASLLAQKITQQLSIPTIGIGAGLDCDGQVLVLYDMLGFFPNAPYKFVKQYAHIYDVVQRAVKQYAKDVRVGNFPKSKHSF